MSSTTCRVCGSDAWTPAYEGPIRDGVFGRERPGRVLRCNVCHVEALQSSAGVDEEYYADGSYRGDVGEAADAESFFARHDHEQPPRIAMFDRIPLRGRVVADIGCGGGSFLDAVAGLAKATIAIEPGRSYHHSLASRGHRVHADSRSAIAAHGGTVDIAVCFSVIEHVSDPVGLLTEIRALLAPGGIALISTPNRDDVLMESGSDAYRRFFYRAVHLYYFEATSLRAAASRAGFASCELVYRHRFPFANFMGWLRDGRPTGAGNASPLGSAFDRLWTATLESSGRADYLYAFLTA
jgi:SAM-dependent methyltransferase